MELRPYDAADAPALEHLLRVIWGNEPQALRYYRFGPDSDRLLGTRVAEVDGTVAGFAAAWLNPFHPHATYIGVNVHPAWRRQGIGTRLLEAVSALGDDRLPLQTSTWETSREGVRFLERHGFREARRTWAPALHLADVGVAAFASCEERCLAEGYRVAPASAVPEEQLASLLREVFTFTHGINPPRPMDLDGWVDLLRKDPPDAAASVVAYHGEQLVAISLAHADEALTFSWSGVTAAHRDHERDLILALALRQVSQAAERGITTMQGEFDSTDPWDMLLMGALPFGPAPAWVTFQRGACKAAGRSLTYLNTGSRLASGPAL